MIVILDKATLIYQGKNSSAKAIDDVSLSFDKGEKVLLFGESGSGKSSLLKVMGGLTKLTYGKAKSSVSPIYVPSDGCFLENFTAYSNVYYWLRGKGVKKKEAKMETDRVLEKVGLIPVRKKKVRRLSGGEKNRLAIARAIALKPDAVFFDEITANLDKAHKEKMIQIIYQELESSLIIFSSHDKEFLMDKCTRVIEMDHGKIKGDSEPKDCKENLIRPLMKKENGSVLGMRVFLKRISGCFLFALGSLLLGFFSSFVAYASYSYNQESSDNPSYDYAAHFENRLVSGGKDDFPNAEYLDKGTLIGNETFVVALTSQTGGGKVIIRDTYIQPVLPKDGNLVLGEKNAKTGFYLCYSEDHAIKTDIYKEDIGKQYNLYHTSQYKLSIPISISLTFNGVYRIKKSSFCSGPDSFLYLPTESMSEVTSYMNELLDKTCQGLLSTDTIPSVPSFENTEVKINNRKLSLLTGDNLSERLGEEEPLTLSNLVLPTELKGKEWELRYLSCTLDSHSSLSVVYSDKLHSGECAISYPALKRVLVDQGYVSSGYYSSESSLKEDMNKGSASIQRANTYSKFNSSYMVYVSLFCFCGMVLEVLIVGLVLLMLRWNRKVQDKDFSLCKTMGYSSWTLRLFGALYSILFTAIGYLTFWQVFSHPYRLSSEFSIILLIFVLILSTMPMLKRRGEKEND